MILLMRSSLDSFLGITTCEDSLASDFSAVLVLKTIVLSSLGVFFHIINSNHLYNLKYAELFTPSNRFLSTPPLFKISSDSFIE